MTNNINVNLAGRLFAYVQHGVDISENIKREFNNSLIFIGDEGQIYVPAKNTYVGIGQTAYSNVVDSIIALEKDVASLMNTARSSTVQKIYPQYGSYAVQENNGWLVDGTGAIAPYPGAPTGQSMTFYDTGSTFEFLTGSIELRALGDYDASTGFAYLTYQVPVNLEKSNKMFESSTVPWHAANTNATSGIRISYHSQFTDKTDPATGAVYREPGKQVITIDDTQTWAYMTAAYTYSMEFSRNYVASQRESLYHDILGIGESILVPVNDDSLWTINPTTGRPAWHNTATLYYKISEDATMDNWTQNFQGTYWATYTSGEAPTQPFVEPDLNDSTHPQFYVVHTNYDNSYNTVISDGIQTLKEVAHLLDQLSDGGLGNVTYMTKTDWETAVADEHENDWSADISEFPYGNGRTYSGRAYRVITGGGNPTTNPERYAYFVKQIDPDNLGIQIAYSIAGNSADIQDLHYHVELAEDGKTGIRSFSASSADMITVSVASNRQFVSTDTGYSLPSGNDVIPTGWDTYSVGDARLIVNLDLASTYVTQNYSHDRTHYGVEFKGTYQKADMYELAGTTVPANTYYTFNNSTGVFEVVPTGTVIPPITEIELTGLQYWYIGQSLAYANINATFTPLGDDGGIYIADHLNEQYYILSTDGAGHPVFIETNDNGEATHRKISDRGTSVSHASYTNGLNQIATTAWTIALVDDKNADIKAELSYVLKTANDYTDRRIDSLDWKMAYGDFDWQTVWSLGYTDIDPNDPEFIAGSSPWKEREALARDQWLAHITSEQYIITDSNYNDLGQSSAYITNRVRSQYISNIIEENGIVSGFETTELPIDELEIHTDIWGNSDSVGYRKTHRILQLEGDANPDPNILPAQSELQQLFAAASTTPNNQIYFAPDDDFTYEVANPAGISLSISDTVKYYLYDSKSNKYEELDNSSPETVMIKTHYSNDNTDSPYWKQLYVKEQAYYEVDLSTIEVSNDFTYISAFEYGKYDASGNPTRWTGEATPDFYSLEAPQNSNRVKYISGNIQHYDFTQLGGKGQNRVNLTANITLLEDATPVNTGLADAWDVASFINNMCEWVDLSASIDANALTRPGFYKEYRPWDGVQIDHDDVEYTGNPPMTIADFIEGTAPTIWKQTNDVNNPWVQVSNPTIYVFGQNSLSSIVEFTDLGFVEGSDRYEFSTSTNPDDIYTAFVREQDIYVNPLNLTLTKFGQ